MKGYEKLKSKYIDRIESTVTLYKHIKSGARILTYKNSDENKVFSIAFKTPPTNNKGLNHILEHSVLCGSKKYPVKDPFVELLKSSLNTFLNAVTFPDKTVYPIASPNMQDFKNLMDVYMDAVFNPMLKEKEEIFSQEGWHYHVDKDTKEITYNGVVYNEMKGDFSSPMSRLRYYIMKDTLPDTIYAFESGGIPKEIPTLSYKELMEYYTKHYVPSNSYIQLYGDMDMEERLEWLDEEYLSKYDNNSFKAEINKQKPFDSPRHSGYPYEVNNSLENNTFLTYNVSCFEGITYEELFSLDIILSVLFNEEGNKIQEEVKRNKIGNDINASIDTEANDQTITILVNSSNVDKEEEFINLVNNYLKDIVDKGINKEDVNTLLDRIEYKTRESMFSEHTPKGIGIEFTTLSTWLYDEQDPYSSFDVLTHVSELRKKLDTRYLEELIEKYILNNSHKTYVMLYPTHDSIKIEDKEIKEELDNYKASLSNKEINSLIKYNEHLDKYKNTPSSKKDLNTIPKLELKDVRIEPERYNLEVTRLDNFDVLYSNYHTNGITYTKYLFDISDASVKEIMLLSLYTKLFLSIPTKKHNVFDLGQLVLKNLGKLNASLSIVKKEDKTLKKYLCFTIDSLDEKNKFGVELLTEVLFESDYSDIELLKSLLIRYKDGLERSISSHGTLYSYTRAMSFINELYYCEDARMGISFYDYLIELVDNFEERKEGLIESLVNIKRFISKNNMILSVCGDDKSKETAISSANSLFNQITDNPVYEKNNSFIYNPHSEAIIIPSQVNYVSVAGKFDNEYKYSELVLDKILTYDYLWQEIRVLGGAYGSDNGVLKDGYLFLSSYRDPHLDRTIEIFKNIDKFIDSLKIKKQDFENYIISCFGDMQLFSHNSVKFSHAVSQHLRELDYNTMIKRRKELYNADLDEVRTHASYFNQALKNPSICVIGKADSINNSKLKFDNIRKL